MNVAGMTLGIIAIVFAFIPIIGAFIAIPCIFMGLSLSSVSFVKKKRVGEGIGIALAGMATNVIALFMLIAWAILLIIGISLAD